MTAIIAFNHMNDCLSIWHDFNEVMSTYWSNVPDGNEERLQPAHWAKNE